MGIRIPKLKKLKKAKKTKKVRKERPVLRKVVLVLLVVIAIGVISGFTVGMYILSNMLSAVNGDLIVDLDEYKTNQHRTSFIYGYDDEENLVELFRLHGVENRVWVDYEDMPEELTEAFIALEDKRFKTHKGVDWYRTIAVIVEYRFEQGGSTITQQLIKNLTGENGRFFSRKYKEIISALNLEKHYSKTTIMETYLNTLYLDQGCYGVETASEVYFGKDVSELNAAECACIAAITQEPYTYDPLRNPDKNRKRQLYCLSEMFKQGFFESEEEYQAAVDYEMVFTNSDSYVEDKSDDEEDDSEEITVVDDSVSSYYVDYVIDTVQQDLMEQYNITAYEAYRKLYYGGLRIYAAVDLEVQEVLENNYYNRIPFIDEEDTEENPAAQSAMTIMDYTGRVVGIIGGAGEKVNTRGLNRAVDSPRPPGSSIKPLSVYAPGIEEGIINWSSNIQNYGIILPGGARWPVNYGGSAGAPDSFVTIQYAVAQSLNTVSAQVCKMLTPQTCYDYLTNNFHITTLVGSGSSSDINYSPMAVGGMNTGVTTLEMAAAYATFGTNGIYHEPYCYYSVTNSDGSEIILAQPTGEHRALSESTAEVMRGILKTVVTSGTGSGNAISGWEMFAKTGTTTDDWDRWYVGGTSQYVAAVWYGYDVPEKVRVSGNPAGRIFKAVMKEIHSGLEKIDFPESKDVTWRTYCKATGLIATDTCLETASGMYRVGYIPATCTKCAENTTITEVPLASTTKPNVQKPSTSAGSTVAIIDSSTTEPPAPITTSPVTQLIPTTSPQEVDNPGDAG